MTREIEIIHRSKQALEATDWRYRRQGGTNEAARFEKFATGVRLGYDHHPMPNSLIIVVPIKRLSPSFEEFAGLI